MTTIIDRMHAAPDAAGAPTGAPARLNNLGNPRALVQALQALGLFVPTALTAAASSGKPLSVGRHRYTVAEVDQKLSAADLSVSDRMKIKTAMGRAGIIAY